VASTRERTSSRIVLARLLAGAALVSAGAPLASCADCFFDMKGHLVECGTPTPVNGATVSVHIDEGGFHGARTLPMTFTSNDAGIFQVFTNGTETCGATATLTINKEGFMQLQQQFKGAPDATVELCMTRNAVAGLLPNKR